MPLQHACTKKKKSDRIRRGPSFRPFPGRTSANLAVESKQAVRRILGADVADFVLGATQLDGADINDVNCRCDVSSIA